MNINDDEKNSQDALKSALSRKQPPDGFAERLLARMAEQAAHSKPTWSDSWLKSFSLPVLRWAAAAAVSAGLLVGGIHYREVQRKRAEGEAAKERLILALRIAGSKLQLARSKVNQITSNPSDNREEKD